MQYVDYQLNKFIAFINVSFLNFVNDKYMYS